MFEVLYIHVPFCRSKCRYCDFDSTPLGAFEDPPEALRRYVDMTRGRLDRFGEAGLLDSVRTAYIGGGTPSVLGSLLPELVAAIRTWCAVEELTCEANPESFGAGLASHLSEAGATRVSFGVQSLDDDELAGIGRLHTAEEALLAIERALGAGLAVSADLMCGLPGQTEASWERSLDGIMASGAGHVSVYPLTLEEGTPLALSARLDPSINPDEDFQAWCMERSEALLSHAGFARYEVASYARPGLACRHNIAYWTGASYLGIGRSAAGMFPGSSAGALHGLFPGAPGVGSGYDPRLCDRYSQGRVRAVQLDDDAASFDFEVLTPREAVAEDLMLAMRMEHGIGRELLRQAGIAIGSDALRSAIDRAVEAGLARWDETSGSLVPTERGWLMGNELFGMLWELAR